MPILRKLAERAIEQVRAELFPKPPTIAELEEMKTRLTAELATTTLKDEVIALRLQVAEKRRKRSLM